MTKLVIGPALELPAKVVTEKLGFLGRTGSGKSYAAMKLAEEMATVRAQFVAIDPVGVWWGLRLAADGKSPGILLPVFGGLHGDVPLEPGTGALIADLIVDRGISCVIDVSHFESDADKARFAEAWAARFYFRKKSSPSAVHVFIEEAQEFVPQNSMRGEERMLHAFTRLQKLGRNFGIGTSLISQRPQEVNKKALNMTEVLFAFQMTGPQERKTMKDWVSEKGIDEDIAAILPKLGNGTAHVWSPAWLQISETVKIGKRWTFDASSTPKVGTAAIVKELAPIDLEQLRTSMAATIEKAKAEDPKLLRARIAELERATKAKVAPVKPVIDEAAIDRAIAKAREGWMRDIMARERNLALIVKNLTNTFAAVATPMNDIAAFIEERALKPEYIEPTPRPQRTLAERDAGRPARAPSSNGDGLKLGGTPRKLLNALVFLESIGCAPATRQQIAGYVGISADTGSFRNNLSELRGAGTIEDLDDRSVQLTPLGRAQADPGEPPTLSELHDRWRGKVSGTEARILQLLIDAYPEPVSRERIGQVIGISHETGSFRNNLSSLRTLGVLADPRKGYVVGTALLYPPGIT